MNFKDYSALVDKVVKLVGRGDLRTEIPGFIELAEKAAVQRIRELREVIYMTTGQTMTIDSPVLTLPEGITGIEILQIDTDPIHLVRQVALDYLKRRQVILTQASDLCPEVFSWTGAETIEMAPIPTEAHAYTLYYKGDMVASSELKYTSQILQQAPDYLYYKAAHHAFLWTRNFETADVYKAEAEGAILAYAQLLARGDLDTPQVAPFDFIHDHPQTTGST